MHEPYGYLIHKGQKKQRRKLRQMRDLIELVITLQEETMADLTRIQDEVKSMSSAVDGAVTLIHDLADQIRENATDEAALNALADELDSKANALGTAIAENTGAADDPSSTLEEDDDDPDA